MIVSSVNICFNLGSSKFHPSLVVTLRILTLNELTDQLGASPPGVLMMSRVERHRFEPWSLPDTFISIVYLLMYQLSLLKTINTNRLFIQCCSLTCIFNQLCC